MKIPSISRSVHYVAYGTPGGEFKAGAHRHAVVLEDVPQDWTPDMPIALMVVNPTGFHFISVPYDESAANPGTWHWPEYVPGG